MSETDTAASTVASTPSSALSFRGMWCTPTSAAASALRPSEIWFCLKVTDTRMLLGSGLYSTVLPVGRPVSGSSAFTMKAKSYSRVFSPVYSCSVLLFRAVM